METGKKFNIIKLIIIIACVILFIGLILPYQSAIGEYKEYLQKNPDTMNVKEVNLTNKDAINVSIIENFKVYSYGMNHSNGNSWLAGESTINFILTIILIVSTILVLVFTLLNFDIVSRGVMPSTKYTYGISYYLYPIISVVILIAIIVLIVKNIKKKKN